MIGVSLRYGARELIPQTEDTRDKKMTMLLWGPSAGGKTQLAETAPGDKLWLMFDPDGDAALTYKRGENHVFDMAREKNDIVLEFKKTDPFGLSKTLAEHPEIETIVLDSMSTVSEKALSHGVVAARATGKGAKSTIEDPGYAGFGHKKTYVMEMFNSLVRIARENERHIIFIAHEGVPLTNEKGEIIGYTLLLGSSLVIEVPIKVSEIWHVSDAGEQGRRIAIRPCRMRRPMRTRMFITNKEPEFVYDYDAMTNTGDGIAEWYTSWKAAGFKKIPVPNYEKPTTQKTAAPKRK